MDRNAVLFHRVGPAEDAWRLDHIVGAWLPDELGQPVSRSTVRRLIVAGVIRIDGQPTRKPALAVRSGQMLEARIDHRKMRAAETARDGESPVSLTILYEDDDLIAVAKPAGVVMHATADPRRADLFNEVRRLLAGRAAPGGGNARALPYLGLHHRLDVETSGVALFTRRDEANKALAAQFAGNAVRKIYHALVARPHARVARAWRVDDELAMVGSGRHARMQRVKSGGARAATDFALLERLAGALLVEARPHTGRKHQIRAHLAGCRMPVLGDARYGGAARAGACVASRVMLHARELSLRHPVTGRALTITCPYPADFAALLACLRRS